MMGIHGTHLHVYFLSCTNVVGLRFISFDCMLSLSKKQRIVACAYSVYAVANEGDVDVGQLELAQRVLTRPGEILSTNEITKFQKGARSPRGRTPWYL